MRRKSPVLLTSLTLALCASAAFAGTTKPQAKHHAKETAKTALICPVTHEKIASISKAAGHSTYQGKTYYFCCSGCKPMFDKNPAKYVGKPKD